MTKIVLVGVVVVLINTPCNKKRNSSNTRSSINQSRINLSTTTVFSFLFCLLFLHLSPSSPPLFFFFFFSPALSANFPAGAKPLSSLTLRRGAPLPPRKHSPNPSSSPGSRRPLLSCLQEESPASS